VVCPRLRGHEDKQRLSHVILDTTIPLRVTEPLGDRKEGTLTSSELIDRLVVYGSLAPGQPNHHHLADIAGTWRTGWVEGELYDRGWGAAQGYPGIRLKGGGPRVDVQVLESAELTHHWDRLDEFEGKEYQRLSVEIFGLDESPVTGCIYALR